MLSTHGTLWFHMGTVDRYSSEAAYVEGKQDCSEARLPLAVVGARS